MKLLRKKSWVLSAVKTAIQAMRCRPARAFFVRHFKMSFGKRGVWADVINAKRVCRDVVVPIEQRNGMLGSDVPGPSGLCRLPGAWRLPKWPVVNELSRKLCRVSDRCSKCLCVSDRVRFKGRAALKCGLLQYCFPEAPPEWRSLQSPMELVKPDLKGRAVIGEEKDHSKTWVTDTVDLNRYVAQMCRGGPGVGQKRRPDASRFIGVALGVCDLGSPGVAQTWEAGDCWHCEITDSLPLGQRQVLWRDRKSKV